MATVNKNFKIKSGLVVEGTTGTINGFNILTENQASEDYIVGIVGGTTLVTSVESTQMEVVAGELNIKSGVFDASGAAAAAQAAAATDATTKANNAKSGAEATASADATSKANAAQAAAEATASADATSKANAAVSTAAADATSKANAAQSAAISAAATDATTKANNAKSGAEATASADATAKANAAQAAAEATAALDATAKADAALVAANAHTDAEVALLVNGAPDLLNTLNELAEAIGENPNYATDLATSVGGKVAKAGDTMTGALTLSGAPTSSLHAATKGYVDGEISDLDTAAQGYASAAQSAAEATASSDATSKANAVAGNLTTHEADTSAHGVTGAVVGTTDTQTLTNKTIGDTLNFAGAGAMTINSDSHIVLTPAAGSSVKWGSNVLATQAYVDDQTTDTIAEAGNLYFTNARAIAAVGGTIGDAINDLDTDDIEEGSNNLYFTNGRAVSATAASYDVLGAAAAADTSARGYADSLAVNYDAAGSANTAYSDAVAAAATDATTKANNAKSGAEATASADATSKANAAQAAAIAAAALDATSKANGAETDAIAAAAADATTKANNAKSGAEATAAAALSTAISTEVTDRNAAISSAIATEVTDRNSAIGTAVSNLVDGAPALLDTLNELALALGDSPSTVTDLTTLVGTKAPLASPALTGVPTAPTAAADTSTTQIATTAFAKAEADAAQAAAEATASADATSKANAAQSAAISAAASDATTKANNAKSGAEATASADATSKANAAKTAAEATAQAALDDVLDATTAFTALNVNDEAKHIAASSSGTATVIGTSYEWAKADYRSAKLLVKIDNGTHNEMSEILVTLDSTDNIAITEYAIVGTNGTRGTITADISGSNVRIRVTPVNNSTIKVTGTLLK
jgi:hypothetical protein